MKKIIQSLFIATAGLTIAFGITNERANALTFQFSQAGWLPGGGELLGTFSGEDVRGANPGDAKDGIISLAQGEVSFFEMSFQGSTTINDFDHNLTELFFLEYSLANPEMLMIFSSNESEGDFVSSYDGGVKLIQQQGDSDITIFTEESPTVREVPESASLIGLTLFGLGLCIKRSFGKGLYRKVVKPSS